MNAEIVKLSESDLLWSFQSEYPFFAVTEGGYKSHINVDPFPAYAHDENLVRSFAEQVLALFPIPQKVSFALLSKEYRDRTNAYTSIDVDYDGEKDQNGLHPWSATIVMSAKRIPIHPAMTRYLVAHEYGHVVAETLRRRLGVPTDKPGKLYDETKLYAEYQKMRGFESVSHYGGGTWHARVEEVFANDFRILVAKSEVEFWPHPGIARPEEVPEIVAFWESQKELQLTLSSEEKS